MRKAVIEDGIVTNVIEVSDRAEDQPDWARDLPLAADAGPGWTWDGKAFAPPPPPEPDRSAMSLSFGQLLIGLVAEGWITEAEGEAWLGGTPPAAALALVDALPAEHRFAARVRITRPSVVLRLDPLVQGLARAEGKTGADLDRFFVTYALF
jgi:predicted outer membrane lipoprotein